MLEVEGIIGEIDDKAALMRAQIKNAEIAETYVRDLARVKTVHRGDNDPPRNRGDYGGPMEQYYRATVDDSADIILDNPTSRAKWFEFGTKAHFIEASGLSGAGRRRPPRGARGAFTRGAKALKFPGPGGGDIFREVVWHPGQPENQIMLEAFQDNMDLFADNIADELEDAFELSIRGGR